MDYKGYKFYLFGCSHTANVHCNTFPFFDNSIERAWGGNSNDKIIRNLKEDILEVTNNLTKKVDDVYFNIQFTYFNRLEIYSDMDSEYFTFHSPNFKNQHFTTNYDLGGEYDDFYTKWLTYFFNEETRLKELLVECRILKNLMDSFGIKYNWYLWAGIHWDEILNSKSYKDVIASVNALFISKPDIQAAVINQLVQTIKESKISDKALQKVIESAAKQIKSAKGGTRKKR